TAVTFNMLRDDFGLKAGTRLLGLSIDQAYELVQNQGQVVTNPDGTTITKAWLDAQPDPELAFITRYVSTFRDLLGTYPAFQSEPALVGGNPLLADLNTGAAATNFVDKVASASIVFSREQDTPGDTETVTGPNPAFGLSNLIQPFTSLIGHLPH